MVATSLPGVGESEAIFTAARVPWTSEMLVMFLKVLSQHLCVGS
jgi:hypothetical protein